MSLIPELQYTTDLSANIINKEGVWGNIVPSLDYHTELEGEKALKENLQKLHHSLNEDNIFSLAYLILNPVTSEEERKRLEQRLHDKIEAMRNMKIPVLDILTKIEGDLESQISATPVPLEKK